MRVTVFGTGYVGLVTGTCLAEVGHQVVCVDIDRAKVEGLRQGIIPIYEPGLEDMVLANHASGRLDFSVNAAASIEHGDIIFIAVGTPPDEDGSADLQYVLAVARSIGESLLRPAVVVNKSTVPVGTADKVRAEIAAQLARRGVDIDFDVVSNPEFLKEGAAVNDCMRPDRIVLGSRSAHAVEQMKRLYAPFNRNHERIVVMDERSAELTKYAANAFLATKITFMNEIANFCEKVGADVDKVRIGIGTDTRIGKRFLFPGIGYGGSCFPKDVQALAHSGDEAGYTFEIIRSVMAVNERQKTSLVDKVKAHYGGSLTGRRFALWGLAFKPDTDDIREAPALYIIEGLLKAGAQVAAFDPEAMPNVQRMLGERVTFAADEYEALQGADALLIATEWAEFRTPDLKRVGELLKEKLIFDGRNLYDLDHMRNNGFTYVSVGRQTVGAKKPVNA